MLNWIKWYEQMFKHRVAPEHTRLAASFGTMNYRFGGGLPYQPTEIEYAVMLGAAELDDLAAPSSCVTVWGAPKRTMR